jgi:hypothetical protein
MEVTSLYDYTKRFTEPQLQFQSALEYPTDFWENYLSDISKGALKSFDIKCPALPDMFWLNKLPIGSSQYIAQDAEDRINEKCASSANSDNISSGQIIRRTSKDSTSSADLNRMNEEFHSSFSKRTQTFVWTLQHIDFEDGVENDIIKEVEGYIKTNRFVTYLWLHSIYSNNQKDIDVLAGLLRIIGMTVEKEDTDMLLTMVKAGLSDSHSKTQEAALMVIEQWRTRNCLIAIETAPSFNSSWLCDYAKQIESELNEELRPC